MSLPLAIILGWLALTTAVGVLAGLKRRFGLEEFFVGDRALGTVLFYTLAAAEIYSAFAFLGLAGWAYAKGVSVVYALAYMPLGYAIYFYLGPRINRLGRRAGYVTQPDFLEDRYGSRGLGAVVALVGVVFTVPYLQLQLLGTGIITQIASGGALGRDAAVVLSTACLIVFVSVSGLRGIGWTNLMQAVVMIVGMVTVGIVVPERLFGGLEPAMATLARLRPEHLRLPDSSGLGVAWYASTVLLSAIGAWMWPHGFATTYGAASEQVVRRNAAMLPLYQVAAVPVVLVGLTCAARAAVDPAFAAAVANPDHAMLVAVFRWCGPWFMALVGAGGVAAAISTASALILTSANLLARNVVQRGLAPQLADGTVAWIARGLVLPVSLVAMVLALRAPAMLVNLLLVGYSGITQLAPGIVLGMFSRWPTRSGIGSGLAAGILVAGVTQVAGWPLPGNVHPGLAGLVVNLVVVVVVSRFTRAPEPERLERFEQLLAD